MMRDFLIGWALILAFVALVCVSIVVMSNPT